MMRLTLIPLLLAIGLPAAARDTIALPQGASLAIDKRGLQLRGADGAERARLALRARHLDYRDGTALVVDANTERAIAVNVDSAGGALAARAVIDGAAVAPDAACLHRDAQGLLHAFLVGKDGQAEQWLLPGAGAPAAAPRLVRKLALPPHSKACLVHDASATLVVNEEGFGAWAYNADAEAPPARRALALRRPHGKLAAAPDGLAPAAQGVTLLDHQGKALQTIALRRDLPPSAVVQPLVQTETMPRMGDAADDPAIWADRQRPGQGRVLGTNKKQGLHVYDLEGRQLQMLESGRLNNVDLRQDVLLDGQRFDLAMATQRDDNALVLYTIDSAGTVAETARFPTPLERIYGICLYQPAAGGLQAFVNDKDGRFLQYRIGRSGGAFHASLVRRFKLGTQPEGCVADDRSGRLFAGEEKRGVWSLDADAGAKAEPRLVLPLGPHLRADVEGMALYHGERASYLVVSSQGSNSYLVADAAPPHRIRGSFRIGFNAAAGIDGASETDGLDVSAANFGGRFARGMLVVQDGYKRLPDGAQNFKYVAWEDIARALSLP
ncbi:phytase [Pseudoduganella sp.]|uniref:phytase n=1 Tax=Pseudoduganella sp. TaxID=1880898 RepID=UPI0035B0E1FF